MSGRAGIFRRWKWRTVLVLLGLTLVGLPTGAEAMTFKAEDFGEMTVSGKVTAAFGATQFINFVDDNGSDRDAMFKDPTILDRNPKGMDSDFDATRELALTLQWTANEYLKAVASFQIGEGSTGGYFGSRDALVGGEEDGDLILELDRLYIDFTIPDTSINFKLGSQGATFPDLVYGSNLMYEVPAGVVMTAPLADVGTLDLRWFRMTDLMDDTESHTDDQADLFLFHVPLTTIKGLTIAPYAAYALIGEDVIRDAPNHWRYSYFDYPALLFGTTDAIGSTGGTDAAEDVNDNVDAWYVGASFDWVPLEPLRIRSTFTYGSMNWEASAVDADISGYVADLVIDYDFGPVTGEVFGLYGNGPDENDDDIDLFPALIGGPTYTSSYFGGSRYNDNMFDSYDAVYATGMWAVGLKLKDIHVIDKLINEIQFMYAEGTADENIFERPNDTLLNEDESFFEVNLNSQYQIMKNFVLAVELGYIAFDEDNDYDEDRLGDVEDLWKAAWSLEFTF